MITRDGRLDIAAATNSRVKAGLSSAHRFAREQLTPLDLICGVVTLSDPAIWKCLAESLRHGMAESDLRAQVENLSASVVPNEQNRSTPLCCTDPRAREALEGFERAMAAAAGRFDSVALEVLLASTLPFLEPDEQQVLSAVDFSALNERLRRRIGDAYATELMSAAIVGGVQQALLNSVTGPPTDSARPAAGDGQRMRANPDLGTIEDLSSRVRAGAIMSDAPLDGDPTFERLFSDLARAIYGGRRRHVLLVAERGVGHSMVLAEFARRSVAAREPFLRSLRFLTLDCRYTPREDSRRRLQGIQAQFVDSDSTVLCIDGFVQLLRTEGCATNLSALLAWLSHTRTRLIAVLEPRDYDELIQGEQDFLEFFHRIEIPEPDYASAVRLVRRFADGLQQRYKLAIGDDVVQTVTILSSNYILNERLPGKAIRILHRVCEDAEFDHSQRAVRRVELSADDVVKVVAEASGVPAETLQGIAERSDYRQSLSAEIYGQEHAVQEVATELGLIKAGMSDPGKPASVMLFVGQTGTGKTEMAKVLARFYSTSKRLRTYTLGNFVEPHSVAGIIGVPPGYVGHDQGGRLINDLNSDPYCVFLLDEADKAHPDVLQPFLNLFDEGWVRDQRGIQARADKSIFILTTNVGQRIIAEMSQQGKSIDEIRARMKEALAQIRHGKSNRPVFAPEFLARIKRVVVFRPLDVDAMRSIANKLAHETIATWQTKRQRKLVIADHLTEWIAKEADRQNKKSEGREGGRIVRKLFSDWIDAPVQRAVSERPDDYRSCKSLRVELQPTELSSAGDLMSTVEVVLHFERD